MFEVLNIVMSSEVLLSIAVLSLVLYGINLSILKMSIWVSFIVGIIVGVDYFNFDQVTWAGYLINGLLITSC